VETCAVLLQVASSTSTSSSKAPRGADNDDPVPYISDCVMLALHAAAVAGTVDASTAVTLAARLLSGFAPAPPPQGETLSDGAGRAVAALWRSARELAALALRTRESVRELSTGGGDPVRCELAAPLLRRQGQGVAGGSSLSSPPSATEWVVALATALPRDGGNNAMALGFVHRLCAEIAKSPSLPIEAVVPLRALLEPHSGAPVFATPFDGGNVGSAGSSGGGAVGSAGERNDDEAAAIVSGLIEWLETAQTKKQAAPTTTRPDPAQIATAVSATVAPDLRKNVDADGGDVSGGSGGAGTGDGDGAGGAVAATDVGSATQSRVSPAKGGDDVITDLSTAAQAAERHARAAAECTLLVLFCASASGRLPAAAPLPRQLRRAFDRCARITQSKNANTLCQPRVKIVAVHILHS
jgi:hypothetical protein